MPVPRQVDLRRDVPGVLLAATTLLVAASLATFHPADPVTDPVWPFSRLITPSTPCFPVADDFQNACGALGALVADGLSQSLGSTALLIPLATGVLAVCYLLRINIAGPAIRSLGGTLFLIAAATGASMLPSMTPLDPVTGGGGNFGAMTSTLLLDHFHPGGSWILTLTVAAVGTLLVSDYFVLHASAVAASTAATGGRKVYEVAKAVPLRRRKPFAGDDLIQLHGEASEPHSPHAGPTIRVLAAKRKPRSEGGEADTSWEDTVLDPQPEPESKAATGQTRQIEAEDETMMLRRDEPEAAAPPPPKIRMATRKRSDREKLNDEVHEDAPASLANYVLPPIDLLEIGDDVSYDEQLEEVRRKAVQLEQTFESFGFNVRVVDIEVGPVIAQYEIELESGLRISKIASLENDIAIALRAPSVRIVAPIPGKNTVGIEIPNEARQTVHLRDVIEEADDKVAKLNIPVFLGKDVSGNPMVVDLAKMPHLLIAGRTGTGKSVCLNAIIASILMKCRPDDVRMLMIDPKMVELSGYGRLPHLMHPVITDMKKAEAILAWAVDKMEERYSMLAKVGVRHINSYNELGREELYNRLEIDEDEDGVTPDVPVKLPFIVIIADEMADLMMTAGKEVETHIIRLAQKSRAVGIHLILATQKTDRRCHHRFDQIEPAGAVVVPSRIEDRLARGVG